MFWNKSSRVLPKGSEPFQTREINSCSSPTQRITPTSGSTTCSVLSQHTAFAWATMQVRPRYPKWCAAQPLWRGPHSNGAALVLQRLLDPIQPDIRCHLRTVANNNASYLLAEYSSARRQVHGHRGKCCTRRRTTGDACIAAHGNPRSIARRFSHRQATTVWIGSTHNSFAVSKTLSGINSTTWLEST